MKIRTNAFLFVISCMLVVMGFYTLERFIFLIWNFHGFREAHFTDILWAFVYGLRFDLYSTLAVNLLAYVMSFVAIRKWNSLQISILAFIILISNLPFFALNQNDIEFSNFLGRRMTVSNLPIFTEAKGKLTAFLMTYSPLIILQVIISIGFIFLIFKLAKKFRTQNFEWPLWRYVSVIVISIPLIVLGIRGGLQDKPLAIAHAIVFDSSYLNEMVLNTTFTMIRGEGRHLIIEKKDFANFEDLKPYLNGGDSSPSTFTENLATRKMNVVLVILESFSFEYMDYAPFLMSLGQKGIFFDNAYANGRRSIEAISSIMTSIPSLMSDALVRTPYFNDNLKGIGTYFKHLGYHTSFFHGGLPGTMYFDLFTKKSGFDHYYSSEFDKKPEDTDNFWGIYDEPFLQLMAGELDKFPKPFLSAVFTLTSHHPYKLPPQFDGKLPTGKIPILRTVAYTDLALKEFFEIISKKPWFNNTIFIFTADHTQMPYKSEFDCSLGRYRIPIILYSPSIKWPEINSHKLVQQVDILPTLLDMFKIKDDHPPLFGKSFFKKGGDQIVINSDQTIFLLKNNLALETRPDRKNIYDIEKDFKLRQPLEEKNPKILDNLDKSLKATIQYYDNGLIENKIYF